MNTLGKKISLLRKEQNLTQVEFSKAIGLTRTSLSLYELDKREPDYTTIKSIANFFDVSTDYLLGKSESRDSKPPTKAFHPLTKDGLTDEDIQKIEEYAELLRLKHKK